LLNHTPDRYSDLALPCGIGRLPVRRLFFKQILLESHLVRSPLDFHGTVRPPSHLLTFLSIPGAQPAITSTYDVHIPKSIAEIKCRASSSKHPLQFVTMPHHTTKLRSFCSANARSGPTCGSMTPILRLLTLILAHFSLCGFWCR